MIETQSFADLLMRGPRGRRLLLEYAIASEQLHDPEYREDSLSAGVFIASHQMDPDVGTSVQMMGDADAHRAAVAPADVAQRLASVPLADVTPGLLRECLAEWPIRPGIGKRPTAAMCSPRLTSWTLRCAALLSASPHQRMPRGGASRWRKIPSGRWSGTTHLRT